MLKLKRRGKSEGFGDIGSDDDRGIEVRRPERESRRHFWAEARLLMRDLVFALMIAILVVVFVVQPVKVEGSSMEPRFHNGERIFVNKLIYYGLPRLERGDVVVFWFPDDPSRSYIKRVIGLPGEEVQLRDGHVYINGKELPEPYLDPGSNRMPERTPSVYVKQHYYFVMGDNRDNSSDSRVWGLVPEKYIYGKALMRYWPLANAGIIRHETEYPGIQRNEPPPTPGEEEESEQ